MEFGQILVCCMKNRFLGCWRLQTSSRLFYGFVKMTIYQHLAIFNGLHLQFSIVSDSPFQKNEPVEHWYNWLLSNFSRLLNWKEPGTYPQSSKYFKGLRKIIALSYIFQLNKSSVSMSCGSKDIYLKLRSFAYTDHDTTDLLNHGNVKNAKTWIHWEWNITFYYIFTFLSQLELSRIKVPKLTPGTLIGNYQHSIRPGWSILFLYAPAHKA